MWLRGTVPHQPKAFNAQKSSSATLLAIFACPVAAGAALVLKPHRAHGVKVLVFIDIVLRAIDQFLHHCVLRGNPEAGGTPRRVAARRPYRSAALLRHR